MNNFMIYWKNDTWRRNQKSSHADKALNHTAGNQLSSAGIAVGDAVYVVTIFEGRLYLGGKIIVGGLVTRSQAAAITGIPEDELWDAKEHLIASAGTEMEWDRQVSTEIVRKLRLINEKGERPLKFEYGDRIDGQTVRRPAMLTPGSAKLLDSLLGKLSRVDEFFDTLESQWNLSSDPNRMEELSFESGVEGNKKLRYVTFFERDRKNRENAIRVHGLNCKACGINFRSIYGELGNDFIHVHHVKPVSQFEKPKRIDPKTDLTVLCANCHSMIHRKRTSTLSVEQLKNIIAEAKGNSHS